MGSGELFVACEMESIDPAESKQPEEPPYTAKSVELALIQKQFALINLDGKVWVLDRHNLDKVSFSGVAKPLALSNQRDGTLLMTRDLVKHYSQVNPSDLFPSFFTHPDTVCFDGVEFNPAGTTPGYINLWKGPSLQSRAGRWDLIRKFLLDVICNGDEVAYQYLIRYLAHALQKPGEKPGVIIILLGGQGTGKGTLGRILHRIWGPSYLQVHDIKAVTGTFNASLERALWVFMDEALFVGDRRSSDSLKSLVTEPLIHINQKHQPARQSRSFHRFVAASNSEHFKHTDRDDRRDFVLRVSEDHKGDHVYWQALHAEIEGDGTAAMMHHLRTLDLSNFNVRDKPQTQALLQQKLMSLAPIPRWWFELLAGDSEEDGWPDFIPTTDIVEAVKEIAGSRAYKAVRPADVIQAMTKLCPSAQKKQKGEKYNRQRGLKLPSLEVARSEFETWIDGKVDW
jgi:hypothetical protein